ncbi:hypothetical protein [Virgisporangium aliadipatigenens]|uniref:hypothetical protein n=1 Tax=Virgisporangium aliadipatigenens TaxID=741659 RepID=UPI0019438AD8|nr:hypothetical protein [Virgisporangium aliadipatigenens]
MALLSGSRRAALPALVVVVAGVVLALTSFVLGVYAPALVGVAAVVLGGRVALRRLRPGAPVPR